MKKILMTAMVIILAICISSCEGTTVNTASEEYAAQVNTADSNKSEERAGDVVDTVNAEIEKQAAEEAARAEIKKKAAEKVARLEAERKAAEEAARAEAEKKAVEEAARVAAQRKAEEAAKAKAQRKAEEAARAEAEKKAAEEAARADAEKKAAEETAKTETDDTAGTINDNDKNDDQPASHEHKWITKTETIHHEAKTHEERVRIEDGPEKPTTVAWDEVLEKDPFALFHDKREIHYYRTYYYNPNVPDRWWVEAIDAEGNWTYKPYDQTEPPAKPDGYQEWRCFPSCSVSDYQRPGDIPITGHEAVGWYSEWADDSWMVICHYHFIQHYTDLVNNITEDIEINDIGKSPYNEEGHLVSHHVVHTDGEEYVITSVRPWQYENKTIVDEEAWDEVVEYKVCAECGARE